VADTLRGQAISPASDAARGTRLQPPLPVPLKKDFIDRLDRELKLKPEQRQRIEKIITEGQECTKKIWQQVEPDMHKTLVDTRAKIRAELSAEQQVRFEELLKQRFRNPQRTTPARDKSTNAPQALLTQDNVLCMLLKFTSDCASSNRAAATHYQSQSGRKSPLLPRTESGS
jgi:Spy/CpxP family protein refolding chaperone